jgi:myo-inositol-1(or 4)-monophosphatase
VAALKSPNLNVMIKAAEKAAKSLIRDFGEVEQLQVSRKGPADFVSAADKRAEKIIFEELQKARPDYSFLMEESGEVQGKDTERRWIIDPLDGTMNFLHGIPHWAISIALEEKGIVTIGLVYDAVKDEMFHAEKNGGAFMRRKRLRVSGRTIPETSVVATGAPRRANDAHEVFFREQRAVWEAGFPLRRYGAAALDLCYVAAGRFEGYWERSLKQWDIAAGMLIVREAGGFYSDIDNDKENPLKTGNIIASNDKLFDNLKKTLRSA